METLARMWLPTTCQKLATVEVGPGRRATVKLGIDTLIANILVSPLFFFLSFHAVD